MRNHVGLMMGFAALIALVGGAQSAAAPPDRATYAAQCAADMGQIPGFNCMTGALLDITVNNVSQTQPVANCDKPVQLGLGGNSQCVPYSRLLMLNTDNPGVTTVAICRKYFASTGPDDSRFDDIAMIQHNKVSGRTCFFQSKLEAALDGRTVPSPSDTTPQAAQYWLDNTPGGPSGITCTNCHAADPFIWSSFVAQQADLAQWDPLGKFTSNFADLFGKFSKVFQPNGNACTSFHRFGHGPTSDNACNVFPTRYSGNLPNATHPGDFLMPPGFSGPASSWHASFDNAFAQVQRCCANPDLAECRSRLANDDVADDGSRFAAIWVKQAGPPFVAHHGMTSQDYQTQFDQLVGRQGFCLTEVSGYDVGGQARYAAIWEKKTCPPFVARHGLTSQEYQQQFDQLVGQQGFRLKLVNGYGVGGQDRYAAIFEKSPGPAFVARHGLTSAEYQQQFDQLVGQQGFHLKLVSGHKVGGQESYAAIFEKSPSPSFVARHGLSSEAYQVEFNKFVGQQGMRLVWVSGY